MKCKKALLFALFTLIISVVSAQNWVSINESQPTAAKIELVDGTSSFSTIAVDLGGFNMNTVQTPRGEAFTISVDNATPLLEKGMPDLPKITTSLIIPDMANMEVVVVSSSYRDFPSIEIAPSKGNILRDTDPQNVPYTYGSAYEKNEFYPSNIAQLREPYILRDYRGQTVVVSPFAYNPVTKVLRVYYQLTLEVRTNGISMVNTFTRGAANNKVSIDFKQIYDRQFINASTSSRYTPLEEQGNMLIICHGSFMPEMEAFVEWKRTIGIPVEIVDVSTIGVNSGAIKTFVANYYATNGLTYLLLVGDNAQIPTVTGGGLGGPSDHSYGYLAGNDHYPDIFVGRFSAETAAHVITQVERSITYEQNPDVTIDWFSKGVGIGSSEGTGDDGEYDWEHMRNIRTDLLGFTYTTVAELYDGSQGGEDLPGNPNSASVATEVNAGRSIINYVGHGSQTSWGTTGFSNSGVNALTNNNMWPYIFSVACVNGEFMNATCFAEAWLRATNATGPTGAVATLMSTINQSWNPPMEGQDEMNDILVESYDDNIKRTFGGVSINGCNKMNDTYGPDGYEMTDTWLIFGDPSLMIRTANPLPLVVEHSDVAFTGSSQFEIECDVEDAIACLTMNGEILGTAIVTGGSAIIDIPVLAEVGMMKLAVTAFNYIPYIADIEIIPLNGPYLVYDNTTIIDTEGNNNQQLDYSETVNLALGLKNAGTEEAVNVTVNIQCVDPYITLNDTTELYPLIPAGEVVSIADAFELTSSADIPEGYEINFTFTATSDTLQWAGTFQVRAHSVVLNYAGLMINDCGGYINGKVDPGETVLINLNILNAGTAPAYNVLGVLSTEDPYILVNVDSVYYGTVNGYESVQAAFTITALPTTPSGHQVTLDFSMQADEGFAGSAAPSIVVGQIPVLIIDLDGNKNSGPAIRTALTNIGVTADYTTNWPLIIGSYQSVFVCLGTYPNNAVLTAGQGQALANFMNNNHGRVYMEGGDTWSKDPQTTGHNMFKITGNGDGAGDLGYINGADGTFTEGLAFTYYGDNSYIDRILPADTAFTILTNASPQYNLTVAYNGSNYRTIGSSFEFGGLINGTGESTKDSLMYKYINFMELSNSTMLLANFIASDQVICESDAVLFTDYSAGNVTSWEWSFPGGVPETSTEQNPEVTYRDKGVYDVTLVVSDGTGLFTTTKPGYITVENCAGVIEEEISNIQLYPNPANDHFTLLLPKYEFETKITLWSASGMIVREAVTTGTKYEMDTKGLPAGVYFVRVYGSELNNTLKLIITR